MNATRTEKRTVVLRAEVVEDFVNGGYFALLHCDDNSVHRVSIFGKLDYDNVIAEIRAEIQDAVAPLSLSDRGELPVTWRIK